MPGDGPCRPFQDFRKCVNDRLDGMHDVISQLADVMTEQVRIEGVINRYADTVARIGKQVDKLADRLDHFDGRLRKTEIHVGINGANTNNTQDSVSRMTLILSSLGSSLLVGLLVYALKT